MERKRGQWAFRCKRDVERFWGAVRSVPGRTEGREHRHCEQFSLGLYLLALAENDRLDYPLRVEHGRGDESPDFMLHWRSGETTGLEVTRATAQWLQRKMTEAEKEYARRRARAAVSGGEAEPVAVLLSFRGWTGDDREEEFCHYIRAAIEKKLAKFPKFARAARYDLLINDDTPTGGVDRKKVIEKLDPWLRKRRATEAKLGRVSIIISMDILFDLGGRPRVFPYIDWSGLNVRRQSPDLAKRVEETGRIAVETLSPIYSINSRGQIVKETPDGRRLQVRLGEDGEDLIFRELRDG